VKSEERRAKSEERRAKSEEPRDWRGGFAVAIDFIIIVVALISAVVVVWPATVICRRVGYSRFLGLLAVVPLANIALLWFVALSRWPSAENRETEMPL